MKKIVVITLFVLFGIVTFFPNHSSAEVMQTGIWGEVTWQFDSDTGELTLTGTGTLGENDTSPWKQETNPITPTDIIKINFEQKVNAPAYSAGLFSDVSNTSPQVYLTNLTTIDNLSNLDTSNVTSMARMFAYCEKLNNVDVSNFDTSQVTDMEGMFCYCRTLTSLNLSNFDTSSVTNMYGMFISCGSLLNLDITNFDTSQVTDMGSLFSDCSSLTELDVTNFDTSQVTDMDNMFSFCTGITSLNVTKFNTSSVTNMGDMFSFCTSITSLDVSVFDTSLVTLMDAMFHGCSSLTNLDISNFDTSQVTLKTGMFNGARSLSSLKLGNKTTFDNTGLPLIDTTSGEYTGRWVLVSDQSSVPQTNVYESSTTFMSDYDGKIPGTYVWERNQQTITASNYTMYIGDADPTVTDFQASATDLYGAVSEVTVDLSTADVTKAGTYDVTITSADGQTITVRLTVKENKQTISASDYTMYVGDPTPTITDFKASAIDKAGNASEVTVDLSTADVTKAGTYSVTITSADGQKITVSLIVLSKDGGKKTITSSSDPVVTNQNNTNLPITGENNTWMMALIGMIAVSTATIGTIVKSKRRS